MRCFVYSDRVDSDVHRTNVEFRLRDSRTTLAVVGFYVPSLSSWCCLVHLYNMGSLTHQYKHRPSFEVYSVCMSCLPYFHHPSSPTCFTSTLHHVVHVYKSTKFHTNVTHFYFNIRIFIFFSYVL